MFLGGYANSMDEKGRVNIPADYRDVLRNQHGDCRLIITRDLLDDCLRAYPVAEWRNWLARLEKLPGSNRTVRRIHRRIVSSAAFLEPDKQGRVLIPAHLRQIAQLRKAVHFAGTNQTFEIWDSELWQKETELVDAEDFDPAMLDEFGL